LDIKILLETIKSQYNKPVESEKSSQNTELESSRRPSLPELWKMHQVKDHQTPENYKPLRSSTPGEIQRKKPNMNNHFKSLLTSISTGRK
jgi:hypothetical protein